MHEGRGLRRTGGSSPDFKRRGTRKAGPNAAGAARRGASVRSKSEGCRVWNTYRVAAHALGSLPQSLNV